MGGGTSAKLYAAQIDLPRKVFTRERHSQRLEPPDRENDCDASSNSRELAGAKLQR